MSRFVIFSASLVSLVAVADEVDYARQIKPILHRRCVSCHGAREHESGLRLDSISAAMKGGVRGPAIVRGRADESLLVRVVNGSDDELKMPPEGSPLTTAEVNLLSAWIAAGAKGQDETKTNDPRLQHWAWQPVRRPESPAVSDASWCRTPIDRFVLARLDAANIKPSPLADRVTLLRRLHLDLRGLPPSVDQALAYSTETRPDGYDRVLDQVLSSPQFGERWGRHWLDVARYGDSNGFTIDSARSTVPVRYGRTATG